MSRKKLISDVELLLGEGKTEDALNKLFDYAKENDANLRKKVILLKARMSSLNEEKDFGALSFEQYRVSKAQINAAMAHMLTRSMPLSPPKPVNNLIHSVNIKAILFLNANPKGTENLRLGEEYRRIKENFLQGTHRDKYNFELTPAVTIKTITREVSRLKPSIIHFSGHGAGVDGIVVENENGEIQMFTTSSLERLFSAYSDSIQCVVMNACYSKEQAKSISKHSIYVIGMNKAINDRAAIDFAIGFYQAVSNGDDIQQAFSLGLVTISPNQADSVTPELWYDGRIIGPGNMNDFTL